MRTPHPLLIIPGTLFWPLFIVGLVSHNDAMFGIAIAVMLVFVVGLIASMVTATNAARDERRRVVRDGTVTTAKIVSIGTDGGGINDHPRIDFVLDVAGNDASYRVKTSALISQLAIPRVQPGCEIRVHVDPRDRTNLVVDAALTPYGH
jgi:hypothetical protein